jgi:hypothetical protein
VEREIIMDDQIKIQKLKAKIATLEMKLESKERQLSAACSVITSARLLGEYFTQWDNLKSGTDGQRKDAEVLYPTIQKSAAYFVDNSVINLIALERDK